MAAPRPAASAAETFDLAQLTFAQAVHIGQHVRSFAATAHSAMEVADCIIDYFFSAFRLHPDNPDCALIRCFLTQPTSALPHGALKAARSALPSIEPDTRCLTLLATRGIEPAWNTPEQSQSHRAIPLPDVDMIRRAPMISHLLRELGVRPEEVVGAASGLLLDQPQRSFNVLHIPEAVGSPFLPAQQDFILQYGVRSALGMGGLLPSGELFAVVLFVRRTIPRDAAELFRTLALSVKLALLPFDHDHIF